MVKPDDYRNVQKLETEQAQTEQPEVQKSHLAVYGHTLSYAVEHGEVDNYRDSRKLDKECKRAIEKTIRQNFDGMRLKHNIVKPLAEQYGSERMAFVLANTLQQKPWDGRFSRDNKAWASEFSISENIVHGMDMNRELIVSSHPAVLDGFIGMFRREVLELEKEMSAGQKEVQDTSGHDVNQPAKQNDWKPEAEQADMEQSEPEVTLTVAECGEFHNMGEFYGNIPTVEEAVAIWKQIPPERMNGIPAIGINIHTPGTEQMEDVGIDILSGKRIDLDILEYIPDIKDSPQAMEMIVELVAKLPEMEIDGHMSEEFEAKVWEKRMPDLTPAEQLAVEIDRFTYNYDTVLYHDSTRNMTENISELAEAVNQGGISHLTTWLADVITEGTEPEETKRAMELLEKLAEYMPLAKTPEMEEQHYNMVDNVLNNGAGEKAQKEAVKREQEQPAAKVSLKARLAEKKAQVAGKDHEPQKNAKKNQREM